MDYKSLVTFVHSAFFSQNQPTYADVNTVIDFYKKNLLVSSGLILPYSEFKEFTNFILKIPIFCNEVISLFEIVLSSYIVHCGCMDEKSEFIKYYMQWVYTRVLLHKIRSNISINDTDKNLLYNHDVLIPALVSSPDEHIQFFIELQNIFILLWNKDTETIINERSTFEKTIIKFVATFDTWKNNILLDPLDTLPIWYIQPAFGLTYHNSNNSTLFGLLGYFYKNMLSLRYPNIPCDLQLTKPKNKVLKIGFLSRAFYNHSIGRISCGLIEKLSEYTDIEIYIYSTFDETKIMQDTFAKRIQAAASKYTTISSLYMTEAVNIIRADVLDALIIVDPCTDIYTYCISMYRCAPVQLTTWGHPETSGSSNIDYYITSKIFEKQIDNIYFEKPVYMNSIGFYYNSLQNTHGFDPIEMFKNISQKELRESLKITIPENGRVYGILSTMYKFHPSFDTIINALLYNDPNAHIIFIQGVHDELCKNVLRRFQNRIDGSHMNRIIMLPYQIEPYSYERLILSCDIILDTFPFGGCISTFDAFSCNKCVITLPGNKLYGRFTQGLYTIMGNGLEELIAKDEIDYIKLAMKIAAYPPLRRSFENKIATNKNKIYENKQAVQEWYEFLKNTCN
jgi:hypothetical protein